MSRITEFKCKDCLNIFQRSEALEKLEMIENTTGSQRFTKVLGCPHCPSNNLEIESMGELDAEE
jgi:Zn finger protein HypA/HybF involved in hydrogenase expression